TVVPRHRDGLRRRVDSEERPGAGNERVFFDHGLVDLDAETWAARNQQVPIFQSQGLTEDFVCEREWIHAGTAEVGVAREFQPFDYVSGPAHSQVRRGEHFQGGAPTVKSKSQSVVCDCGKYPLTHGEPTLATDIHLNVIGGA